MSDVIDLLANLVRIHSVNPTLQPGSHGEREIAKAIASWFREQDMEVHWLESTPARPNVVGIVRGIGHGPTLMFNGHMDTVGLTPFEGDPLQPRVVDGKMYGRGTYDMKGGVAAMLIAAKRVKKCRLRGDLVIACVSDEEHSSIGTEEVLRSFCADAAIVTEPSQLEITVAHKGFAWFEVVVHGRAAHGSRDDLGIDAIAKMGRVLMSLEQYHEDLQRRTPHPMLGHASVHASLIDGGQEWSSYPEQCRLRLERRTLPDESLTSVEAEIHQLLESVRASDNRICLELFSRFSRRGMEISPEHGIVQLARKTLESLTMRPAVLRGESFWTDAALLQAAGIPAFLLGAAGGGAHSANEYVDLDSVETLSESLFRIACEFLN